MPADQSLRRPSDELPAAGWITWPNRSQVQLTGADRLKFLHNFCTNDIKKLQPGQGCEAFLTTIKGRILGHFFAFAGPESLLVDTVPGDDRRFRDHLDKYLITEDVQVDVITAQTACFYLFGTAIREAAQSLLHIETAAFASCEERLLESSPGPFLGGRLRRIDILNRPGFELCVPASQYEACREALNSEWGSEVEADAWNAFRIDAGFPQYGVDLTEDHLAQEADRTSRAISFTKGCYLGQEPIARIDALGHVNRELRIVAFQQGDSLTAPVNLIDADSRAAIGALTSIGRVPAAATVGLGVLRTSAKPGTRVLTQDTEVEGVVVSAARSSG